jgi:ribonucleotide reductase alpha subunit
MKYSCEIVIDKPVDEVISKLDSPQNFKHWQEGLVATEHLSGDPGELGAKMKLTYRFGKREMEMTETILKRAFPKEYHVSYATNGMRNIQKNYFKTTKEGFTKWVTESEFQPTSFRMRALLFLMPNAFKKQSFKYMSNFKKFIETGKSVANA